MTNLHNELHPKAINLSKMHPIRNAWTSLVMPILQRPKRLQVAALCYRPTTDGIEVLMITSRDTGRWILPKGWPIDGLDAPGAALQEAWEEAGVKQGKVQPDALGTYDYEKRLTSGLPVPVETHVFKVEVVTLKDEWPESGQRKRRWVSPQEAANMVAEPALRDILNNL